MPGWLSEVPVLIADALFSSPKGVLQFHRLCLMESFFAMAVLALQLVLFGTMDSTKYDNVFWLWTMMVSVPLLAVLARLRSVMSARSRCEQIMGTFQYRTIVEDLELAMRSREARVVRVASALLAVWCFLCALWLLLLPPCGDLATNPDARFEFSVSVSAEKTPCVVFECSCTLLLFTSGAIATGSLAILEVLRRSPRNFSPPMGGALPPEFLERLPTLEVRESGDDCSSEEGRWLGKSCSICLQDFQAGDLLRVLPCGHGFHKTCVDEWLRRASACPMRCQEDLQHLVPVVPGAVAAPAEAAAAAPGTGAAAAAAG
eukprot:CAMPEP_0175685930 /NCGR_PEP_ID=MMETSP0097-20121207/27612_1 /TAXON_ID=311494 /ORGANISM="Alexandrium monilatum, Strain CCMP3105" /LENGTH=316 /DNA_ID=CAMNT_0016992917 /DNA_START=55 /DNA_END=1001 /DNA_ORIENTATION=-